MALMADIGFFSFHGFFGHRFINYFPINITKERRHEAKKNSTTNYNAVLFWKNHCSPL